MTSSPFKTILINYIYNSPVHYLYQLDWEAMTVDELLTILNADIDSKPCESEEHSYKMVEIRSYADALEYKHLAPDWCIIESEEAYDTHVSGEAYSGKTTGGNRFFFFERDDARSYTRKTFGPTYPYDNYGLSLIALCVDKQGEIVSVTSRWNFEECYDRYLSAPELERVLHAKLTDLIQPKKHNVSVLHIADTHGKHRELTDLPEADIIVHSGDFTATGSEEEAFDFINWFCDLPYRHKVFIAGNHDLCLEGANLDGLDLNCYYLNGTSAVIEGLKFHGIPLFPSDMAEGRLQTMFRQIPTDTDVLITHQPPYGYCDLADYGNGPEHRGDRELAACVDRLQPRLHLFGHEHDAFGTTDHDGTTFSNGALADRELRLTRKPRVFRL
jgi:Icc-related predicted phosphoesterase